MDNVFNRRRVMKLFTGAGVVRTPGEIVDVSEWKNVVSLQSQRFVEPVDAGLKPVECKCKRVFDGRAALDIHLRRFDCNGTIAAEKNEAKQQAAKRKVAKKATRSPAKRS